MELLHRISAQAARGGLRLCRFSDGGCAAEIAARSRTGSICRMSGGGEGSGPVRFRPRQSTKLSKQVSSNEDDDDGTRKSGLEDTDGSYLQMSAEKPEKQLKGPGTGGRRTRRPHSGQGLPHQSSPVSDDAALTKRTDSKPRSVKQERSASASRKDPLMLHLTYADGRQLETTFEDGRSIFDAGNDEVKIVHEKKSEQGLPHQSLSVSDTAALTKRTYSKPGRVTQEQNASSSRKGPLLLHLTYADGRRVETTFEDGRSIFDAENDEVKIVHEKRPAKLPGNGFDHSNLDGMEDLGSEIPLVELKKSGNDERALAKRYALSLLAAAPQPVANLRKKLSGKNISSRVIEDTIKSLQRSGLQSDREYAELFARSRWRSFSWGPARIKLELRGRGLSQEDIEMATKRVFETVDFEENADGDQDAELNHWGMTAQAKERLLKQAGRQWLKGGPGVSNEARQRRMIGWLQRRGFKWSIVTDVLKSLGGQQNYDLNFLEED